MSGKLWGVGVGPGDPEMMTLKAINTIKKCNYIAVPGRERDKAVSYKIAKGAVENLDLKECICLNMPMTRDKSELAFAHNAAAVELMRYLENGSDIAFLTLGDPVVYSTFIYVKDIVEANGYSTEIVNGITSFCAAASLLNEELTIESEELHVIPMLSGIEEKLELPGTKIIMKPSENYLYLKDYLISNNYNAMLVVNAGMENEASYKNIKDFPDEIPYFSIMIVK